jgi:hypothetical protein
MGGRWGDDSVRAWSDGLGMGMMGALLGEGFFGMDAVSRRRGDFMARGILRKLAVAAAGVLLSGCACFSLSQSLYGISDESSEITVLKSIAKTHCPGRTLAVAAFDGAGQELRFSRVQPDDRYVVQPGYSNVDHIEIQWLDWNGKIVDAVTYHPLNRQNIRYLVVNE